MPHSLGRNLALFFERSMFFSQINMTFSKTAIIRFECHRLFVQIFTSANFDESVEQLTFEQFDRLHVSAYISNSFVPF